MPNFPNETPIGNPSQWEAIRQFRGPCEVLAGPGSGKTFVLVRHILYLIEHYNVDPSKILVLTFSKAAALEMQGRFHSLSNGQYRDVTFGTFHSVFYRIYQCSTDLRPILIEPSFKQQLLQAYLRQYLPDHTDDSDLSLLADFIAKVKTTALPAETEVIRHLCEAETHFQNPKALAQILSRYRQYLQENRLIDFEDMIGACLELLQRDVGALEYWQKRFHYCLVDEFQDLNDMQWKVLRLLMERDGSANLFVVGDDDQAIYGFRGSRPSILRDFTTTYETAVRIPLEINYRCSSDIVHVSERIIESNRDRIPKSIIANRRSTGPAKDVEIRAYRDRDREYADLCRELETLSAQEQAGTAVIFRTHGQAQYFLRLMNENKIEYQTRSVEKDPMIREILQDITSYYRLAMQNTGGALTRSDLYRVMNKPSRYLGRDLIPSEKVRPSDLQHHFPEGTPFYETIESFLLDLTALYRLRPTLSLRYLRGSIGFEAYLQSVYGKKEKQEEIERLWKRLEELAEKARYVGEFLTDLEEALTKESMALAEPAPKEASQKSMKKSGVHVITMHACKGLEYDLVYLPDLNEGVIPNRRAVTTEEVEEERRLFYVAMTRAKNKLIMMFLRGEKENPRRPSRFLQPLGNFNPSDSD